MFNFGSNKLKADDAVKTTPVGKNKAYKGEGSLYRVLMAVEDNGGFATIRELEGETGLDPQTIRRICEKLIQSGYIQRMKGGADNDY